MIEKDRYRNSWKCVCLQSLGFFFCFFSSCSQEWWAEGRRAAPCLFQASAEGNQCRRSSGNHSATSLEDPEKRRLTRVWACWDKENHPHGHCRFQFGCGAVDSLLLDTDYTPYMPSWISRLSHCGTLYNLQRGIHFLCGYKKFCFVKINVTHVPNIAILKIKWSFILLFWKVFWQLFIWPVFLPLMPNNCYLLLDVSFVR